MTPPDHAPRRCGTRIAVAVALALAGCSAASVDAPGATSSAPPTPAAEDGAMCREHGVLEAICTKCNPKLIPIFRAKGDFCEEHGLPESVCPQCHPERGGKPAVAIETDDAPRDGLRVKLGREDTARLAGLETVKAEARPNADAVTAPVRIVYDATKVARVNARSPGVVRSLFVDVGTKVVKGQDLVAIDSPEVGANRARIGAAKARVALAQENHERAGRLVASGIESRKTLRDAEQELATAQAEHAALGASLAVFGAGGRHGVGAYTLTAPLGGVVTERNATLGELVAGEGVLVEIVDPSSVWAELDIAETDLGLVAVGQLAVVRIASLGERAERGAIGFIAPAIDPHTRTAKARVPLANADGALRANMYGDARIAAGASRTSVTVPRAAVQRARGADVVFVQVAPLEYELRRVKLGARDPERVEVLRGVAAGEAVVTTGAFLLKTETLKESIGAGCCPED
ncbi:MAG: efflux RND transporter periplasmic adaptor subunit [Myxococcales bacterium]|nr:efflux RND transporter periplasmic adaptor subunit [Myxococcales bacterium]